MKKIAVISLIAASFLIVGCGEKPKEETKKTEVKKEVQALQKEVKEEKKTSTKEETKQKAPKVAGSSSLYAKCAGCHGAKGEKKALGKSAPINRMNKAELIKKIKGYKEGTLNQYGMGGLMKGQVASLSEKDIEDLAEYISKLK